MRTSADGPPYYIVLSTPVELLRHALDRFEHEEWQCQVAYWVERPPTQGIYIVHCITFIAKVSELGILFKSRVQPLVIAASSDEKKDLHSVDDIFENYVRDCTLLFTKEEDYVFIMDSSHG